MKKKRYLKKKKEYRGEPYIPPVYVPKFLGFRLNINNVNQDLLWPSMEKNENIQERHKRKD